MFPLGIIHKVRTYEGGWGGGGGGGGEGGGNGPTRNVLARMGEGGGSTVSVLMP